MVVQQAGVAIAGEVADILRRDEDLITRLTDCRRKKLPG